LEKARVRTLQVVICYTEGDHKKSAEKHGDDIVSRQRRFEGGGREKLTHLARLG